jgi:ACS family pantothenate transporter-like MFS transporter
MALSASPEAEKISEFGQEVVVQKEPRRRWVSYLWDSFDKSPEERWFLFAGCRNSHICIPRYHIISLTSGWLSKQVNFTGFFLKYLDQININSAFVSGMLVVNEVPLFCMSLLKPGKKIFRCTGTS